MAKKYKSDALATVHETASDLTEAGVMPKRTMKEFDEMCLTRRSSRFESFISPFRRVAALFRQNRDEEQFPEAGDKEIPRYIPKA